MRRIIQCSAVVLLSACTTFAFAGGYDYSKEDLSGYNLQPNFKVSDESDYSRDGHAVYFFGGYVRTYRFLKNENKIIHDPIKDASYSYTPKNFLPSSFNGLEVGVGKEVTRNINFEAAYMQQFEAKKSGTTGGNNTAFSTAVKMNGVLGDVGYVFNPDDMFQVMAKLGVMLAQFTTSATIAGSSSFTFNDSTKVDPALGMEFLFQFSKNFGLRMDGMYVADSQSTNTNGEVNALVGLNYTL